MRRMIVLFTAALLVSAASAQTSVPYFSDLESDPGGWTGTGDWQHGIPVGFDGAPYGDAEPVGGYSGEYAWGTIIGGAHNPSVTSDLTQSFNLSGASAAELRFWEWSESGGNAFDKAEVFVNDTQHYISNGDSNSAWRLVVVDLTAYAGQSPVEIDFRFTASSVVERVGWYIDDITVTPEPASLGLLALGGLLLARRR